MYGRYLFAAVDDWFLWRPVVEDVSSLEDPRPGEWSRRTEVVHFRAFDPAMVGLGVKPSNDDAIHIQRPIRDIRDRVVVGDEVSKTSTGHLMQPHGGDLMGEGDRVLFKAAKLDGALFEREVGRFERKAGLQL